ncbi:ribonucleases P/MRP protein subunit pop7 [Rhizoclosmatium sp. JEL0117]|nr:ribonucleases P/MRP protein subunit pop7 [Rhizoclosmatium sp. JEL0117]
MPQPKPTGTITKRAPQRKPTLESDVYVSRKSNFKAVCKRCETLLKTQKVSHVMVHGLGAAVTKAVSIALAVKDSMPGIELHVTTSTVNLIDDVINEDDEDADDQVNERKNSAIHIRITRTTKVEGALP